MKIARWQTLLGERLVGQRPVAALFWGIAGLSVLLLVTLNWVNMDLTALAEVIGTESVSIPHVLIAWSAALLALVVAAFAWVHASAERHLESLIIAAGMPFVAVLEGIHALAGLSEPGQATDEALLWTWWLSRSLLATLLLVGGFLALHRGKGQTVVAGSIFLGVIAVVLALRAPLLQMHFPGAFQSRPWELLPLALFLAAGLYVFPELHRRNPTILSHAVIASTVPQVAAQLESAYGMLTVFDSHFVAAQLCKVLGFVLFLMGILLDYRYLHRSRKTAIQDFRIAQEELETKTEELEKANLVLVNSDREQFQARRSLRMLEKAVETMSLGVTVSSVDGKILYVNPADAGIHGYEVEELIGKNARIYSPMEAQPVEDTDSIFLHPWNRERTNVTSDGRVFPVRLVSDMVRDDNGQPIALVTLCEDISDRKQIEAALERRDKILEAVGLAAERFLADTIWETSVEEVLESLKKATQVDQISLVQVEDPRVLRRKLGDTWSPMDRRSGAVKVPYENLFPRWESELRKGRLVQGRVETLPEDERRLMKEKNVRSFAVVPIFAFNIWLGYLRLEATEEDREWSPVELEALRTAARTFGAAIHRKQAADALASSQAKYRDLLESANDLVQSISPNGSYQFVNRAWREALGYDEQEMDKLTLWDVVRPEDHGICSDILEKILAHEDAERFEVVFLTKDNQEIYLEGDLNCRFVDNRPVAVRGIFRDISERRVVDRMKNEFISTVSHELRTPLTSIIASLGLLQNSGLGVDRSKELLAVAHRNSIRLLHLINDLLDLQKLVAKKVEFQKIAVDVGPLLNEVVSNLETLAEPFNIQLTISQIPKDCRVLVDRGRLVQILENLISNAIKFSPADGEVLLSAVTEEDLVTISVSDQGPGIPEELQDRIFEQFTQGDSSPTRAAGGSGLGLSIVQGLVDGMGGKISLETELGAGTTFHVSFSAASNDRQAAA